MSHMESRDDIRKELGELSPLLRTLRDKLPEGPNPPPGYLDGLKERLLMQQMHPAQARPSGSENGVLRFLRGLLQPAPALAFCTIAVLLICFVVFYNRSQTLSREAAPLASKLDGVDTDDMLAYVEQNYAVVITDTVPAKKTSSGALSAVAFDLSAAVDSLDLSEIEAFLNENPEETEGPVEDFDDWEDI